MVHLPAISGALFVAGIVNLELAAMNLLFIEGLDGSRIIREILNLDTYHKMRSILTRTIDSAFDFSQIFTAVIILANIAAIMGW